MIIFSVGIFNSIQDYLYSAFYDTIVAKNLVFIIDWYIAEYIYLTCGRIRLILYIVWGVGIISSQVFGHLRSLKDRIQTEACVILETEKQIET